MTKLNEKIDELKVGVLVQVISSSFRCSFVISWTVSHLPFLLQAQIEELKVDLSKAKKGKPLGYDKEGKAKRNLAPEM